MTGSCVFVRGGFAVWLALALVLTAFDASARDIRWLREEQGNAGREQQRPMPEPWQQRQQAGPGEERRPEQRMSPEERRQLRRDIRDAGREIYPRR